ncbi:dTDP-4-dehydrorhamnose 3,5-epimerase [Psychrobacter piscatorii]|uniref:dTDP-4-dehydrorhamnose 3,5-epimerase n=1 Tax=Psychrobacter piscatorii TaxID=554343 RepID=UPI00191A1142|nr:dTDP-4-dehydrorhamnose 3,5-epimerase [Psychrobacter piscatorii]
MNVIETKISDLLIFEPRIFSDERGWFMESFNQKIFHEELEKRDLDIPEFVQDNHSCSEKGVLRGLHYQLGPYAQGKLVRVVQGRAWDVAVDIRKGSPTFGQWVGVELDTKHHRQFWIPAGFAHGFVALEDDTHFLYKTTNFYHKDSERSIVYNDKTLSVDWQLNDEEFKLTNKDHEGMSLEEAIKNNDIF